MSCKIVPSDLPHFEKQIRILKSDKREKKRKLKTISPNLLTKTFFFFLAALLFRVPEHMDLKNKQTKKKVEGFLPLFA